MREASEDLPDGASPMLSPVTTGLGEVLMWTVDFTAFDPARLAKPGEAGWQAGEVYRTPEGNLLRTSEERATYLRTVQDWIIAPQMRSSPGLAGVDTVGGYVKEYGVHPDSAKLAAHGLGLADLVTAPAAFQRAGRRRLRAAGRRRPGGACRWPGADHRGSCTGAGGHPQWRGGARGRCSHRGTEPRAAPVQPAATATRPCWAPR